MAEYVGQYRWVSHDVDFDRGGQGAVTFVRRDGEGERFVLKVPKYLNRKSLRRFITEIRTLQALNDNQCPNIVAIIDANPTPPKGEPPWFVMKYYRAGAMGWPESGRMRYLERYKGNIPRVLTIVRDIARALDFIHEEEGIPHRDVKCGNIFFDVVDGPPALGDFGIAYAPDVDGPETTLGETLGPKRWRPPELRSGSPNKRHRKFDIYMLGGVLFEALTGGDHSDDVEQPGRYRHELPALTIARFTEDPRVDYVNSLLRLMFRDDPDERCPAAAVARLCDEIIAWSPGSAEPHFPMSNPADEAAARYHTRRGTTHIESVQNELRTTCDSVVRACDPIPRTSAAGLSSTVETNVNDQPAFEFIRSKFPDAQWMAVRAKVDFDVPPNRILRMSYIFIGRLGPDKELVGSSTRTRNGRLYPRDHRAVPGTLTLWCELRVKSCPA